MKKTALITYNITMAGVFAYLAYSTTVGFVVFLSLIWCLAQIVAAVERFTRID